MAEDQPMPKSMQIRHLTNKLKSQGTDPDTVDLEALVDEKLRYPENEANILSQYGKMSEQQMFEESAGGQLTSDIESLKRKMVSREDVERLIAKSMKAREAEFKSTTPTVPTIPTVQSSPGSAAPFKRSFTGRLKNLRGAGYKKFIQPHQEKKRAEEKSRLEKQLAAVNVRLAEQKEMEIAIKQGKMTGTRQAARQFYRKETQQQLEYQQLQPVKSEGLRSRLVSLLTGYQNTSNPALKRQLATEIIKKRNELLIAQEVERRTFPLQMQQAARAAQRQQMLQQLKQGIQQRNIPQQQPMQMMPQQGFHPMGPPMPMQGYNPMAPHHLARPMPVRRPSRARPQQARPGRRGQPQVPVFIPPHRPDPNMITGVCRFCGQKHMRFL